MGGVKHRNYRRSSAGVRCFRMDDITSHRIDELAEAHGLNRSQVLHNLVMGASYSPSAVFALFDRGASNAAVVIQTDLPPHVVSDLRDEYLAALRSEPKPRVELERLRAENKRLTAEVAALRAQSA